MRARYYSPEIMRFVSADPYKDGWNWYAYANGNPISCFDPFGLFASCPSGINWGLGALLSNTFGDYWREGIDTMHSWGGYYSIAASYFEGVMGTVGGVLDYATNPLLWVKSAYDFINDPWRNNPIYAIGSFYGNLWNASMNGNMNAVAYSLGSATVTLPMVAGGLKQTPLGRVNINRMPPKSGASSTAATGNTGNATGGNAVYSNSPLGSKRNQFDQPRYQLNRNSPTNINGRYYTGHALDRMQDRGIMPSVVENTIAVGKRTTGRDGITIFTDNFENGVRVLTNQYGGVVTVYRVEIKGK